jgi:signal transduction histidine kinase
MVVTVEDGWLAYRCADDGIGIGSAPTAGNGIANMSARAGNLGGTCELPRREPNGTILEWRVPVSSG